MLKKGSWKCNRAEPQDACEPYLATTAGSGGHGVSASCVAECAPSPTKAAANCRQKPHSPLVADFINSIGQSRSFWAAWCMSG